MFQDKSLMENEGGTITNPTLIVFLCIKDIAYILGNQ